MMLILANEESCLRSNIAGRGAARSTLRVAHPAPDREANQVAFWSEGYWRRMTSAATWFGEGRE